MWYLCQGDPKRTNTFNSQYCPFITLWLTWQRFWKLMIHTWMNSQFVFIIIKPRICIKKKWVPNSRACHGLEPNIQLNAYGRRMIVVRTPCVRSRHSGSAQAAQCGRLCRSSITARSPTTWWSGGSPRSPSSQRGRRPVWRGLYQRYVCC